MSAVVVFLSGFAGLVCEVVWARWFATVYGGTTPAGAAVLVAYLAGLSLGGAWLGRRVDKSDNASQFLAILQLGIAIAAALSLMVPVLLPRAYGMIISLPGANRVLGPIRFLLAGLFLLVPSILMGGTLPAAVRRETGRTEMPVGERVGWLRGVNLLGAMLGALGTALWLVPVLGLRKTVLAAAGLNVMAAGVAALGIRQAWVTVSLKPANHSDLAGEQEGRLTRGTLLGLAGITGALTLCIELAQMRAVAFFSGGTLRSFSAVTAAWLLALGLGSALGGILARRRHDRSYLARILSLLTAWAGAGAGGSVAILAGCEEPVDTAWRAVVSAALCGVPLGAVFPLLVSGLARDMPGPGRIVGSAGAALEAGSVSGPILCALVFLPMVGTRMTLLGAGVLATLVSAGLVSRRGTDAKWPIGLSVFLALSCALWFPLTNRIYAPAILKMISKEQQGSARLLSIHEGLEGVVSVIGLNRKGENQDVRVLCIGRKIQADDTPSWLTLEKTMGVLPALLCPARDGHALHVGVGSGVTVAWSAAGAPDRIVEAAELVPGVAAVLWAFHPHNEVGRFSVRIGDGRSLLAAGDRKALIVTDIVFPEDAGAGGLFSVEYFRLARDRLEDRGLFMHWMPLWQMPPEVFRSVVRSFLDVFPEATLWSARLDEKRPLVGLAGFGRNSVSIASVATGIQNRVAGSPGVCGLASADDIMSRRIMGPTGLAMLCAGAPRSTDDYPVSELTRGKDNPAQWAKENLRLVLGGRERSSL